MGFRITFTDNNVAEEGHNIYRSETSMAGLALAQMPPPLVTLGPDVTEWEDGTVTPGETFYYRVGAFTANGTVELLSEEFEAVAEEVDSTVWFAHRSASIQAYEQAVAGFFADQGRPFNFLPEGGVAGAPIGPSDVLIIGAPGTDYTEHPEAAAIATAPCRVVSFCRFTSRVTLGMASTSSSESGVTAVGLRAEIAANGLLSDQGYGQGQTVGLGSSTTGHSIYNFEADTEFLAGWTNSPARAGLAARVGGNGRRNYHFGYHRADLASADYFSLLNALTQRPGTD